MQYPLISRVQYSGGSMASIPGLYSLFVKSLLNCDWIIVDHFLKCKSFDLIGQI